MRSAALATVCLLLLQCSAAYRVLVYNPKFGHSHVNFVGNLADILAAEGFDVVGNGSFGLEKYNILCRQR